MTADSKTLREQIAKLVQGAELHWPDIEVAVIHPDSALEVADRILALPSLSTTDAAREVDLHAYDAGLLSSHGGGNVDWWQDYIRAELARAHDFYIEQVADALNATPPARDPAGVDVRAAALEEAAKIAEQSYLGGVPAKHIRALARTTPSADAGETGPLSVHKGPINDDAVKHDGLYQVLCKGAASVEDQRYAAGWIARLTATPVPPADAPGAVTITNAQAEAASGIYTKSLGFVCPQGSSAERRSAMRAALEVYERSRQDTDPATAYSRRVTLPYTNWRGEFAEREIVPVRLFWGSNEWHEALAAQAEWLEDVLAGLLINGIEKDRITIEHMPRMRCVVKVDGILKYEHITTLSDTTKEADHGR